MTPARGLVAVVVLMLGVLSGCATGGAGVATDRSVETVTAGPRTVTDRQELPRPQVGDCWQHADDGPAATFWTGDVPVDCAGPHNAITVAVADVDPTFRRPGELIGLDVLKPEAWVAGVCDGAIGRQVPGEALGTRVQPAAYLPTWAQWRHGERWLRCDVEVIALGPTGSGALEDLPERADDVVAASFADYAACYDTPTLAAGLTVDDDLASAVYVPCDGSEDWRYGQAFAVETDEFPGLEHLSDMIEPYCDALLALSSGRSGWTASLPNRAGWAEGSRTMVCWLT